MKNKNYIYFEEDADINTILSAQIAVIGYGNQGRAQALNMRDSGLKIIIGNKEDAYKKRAQADNFQVYEISEAVSRSEIVFLLTPDETMPELFEKEIKPYLSEGTTIIFASGYNIGFNLLDVPKDIDVIMIAPRMIGIGVRERFLNKEGYFSFVSIHQNYTKNGKEKMLALAKALGTLKQGVIEMTMKQEAILDLFNEQAFGPAFGNVLLTSINILIKNGLPPEAVLTEMYLSEEMAYTYKKFKDIGIVKQTNFHSHTSQYGAMSRGVRYLSIGKELTKKFQQTYDEIESGSFTKEWQKKISKIKFKLIKYFAMKQKINKIEREVRKSLNMKDWDVYNLPEDIEELLKKPELSEEVKKIEDYFEY